LSREVYWYQEGVDQITLWAARNHRQANRILVALRDFGRTNRGDLKKLQGAELWRLRVGDWRIAMRLEGPTAWILE
jgi:hypothetical protein